VPSWVVEKVVSFDDHPAVDLADHLPTCLAFIEAALANNTQHAVLVHCTAGISRSATVVIAYLMRRFACSFLSAYAFVAEKRPVICPNSGFQEQLRDGQWFSL
jgi:atypical dual specificity phosphatase